MHPDELGDKLQLVVTRMNNNNLPLWAAVGPLCQARPPDVSHHPSVAVAHVPCSLAGGSRSRRGLQGHGGKGARGKELAYLTAWG